MNLLRILFLLIAITSCSSDDEMVMCKENQLEYNFESDFDQWLELGGSGEIAAEKDITLSSEEVFSGSQSVKFIVTPESYIANGNRAELTFDGEATEGIEKWYSWKIFIPEDYPDVTLRDAESEPNWQIMGQWHQQPIFEEGETWDNFKGRGESPPVSINYYYLDQNDLEYQRLLNEPQTQTINGFDPTWNNQSVFFLTYGTPPLAVAVAPIEKGQWIDVVVNVYWSEGEDGYVRSWINGSEITEGKIFGSNMWNKASHYFKFGLYKNPDIPHTNILYYDDLKIGYCEENFIN